MAKAEKKPKGPYNPPPPGGYTDLCGVCRRPLESNGKCADCGGWPFSKWLANRATGERLIDPVSRRPAWSPHIPRRACPCCAGPITVDGGCDSCQAQVGPSLIHPAESPVRGIWVESEGDGPFPVKRLPAAEAKARLRAIFAGLRGLPLDPWLAPSTRSASVPDDSVPF